jgi:uncharacterized protein YecE (DUF72 family)
VTRGTVRVGISGWTYPPWRGVFYPKGLPQRRELEYASQRLTSIEVNGSFYALQKPESWQSWRAETPDGFVFAVKGGRFITHMKKLNDVAVPLANFLASGMLALGDKLGPMLWQLPPNLGFDAGRVGDFLDLLPRTTADAAAMAAGHDERMEGRAFVTTDADRPLRHAMEVRHPTFETDAFLDLLRSRDVAVVTADTAGKWPVFLEPTASLAYVRLHGDEELYVSGYDDEALDRWAARVAGWAEAGHDVVVYFDNDAKVRAPVDAMALMTRLGLVPLTAPGAAAPG